MDIEFEVTVKEIQNGWLVEATGQLNELGEDYRPTHYLTRNEALQAAADWLLSRKTKEDK